jgi:hypothetical protein
VPLFFREAEVTTVAAAQNINQCLRCRSRDCSAATAALLTSPRHVAAAALLTSLCRAAAAALLASPRHVATTSSEARSQSHRMEMSSNKSAGKNFADELCDLHRSTRIFREIHRRTRIFREIHSITSG